MTDEEFDDVLRQALESADAALEGTYKRAMRDLLALSMAEIKSSVPTVSYIDYSSLLSIVEQASAANIAQADLKDKILSLGGEVVRVAKLIPSLASLF
jgi:hypothetical protein